MNQSQPKQNLLFIFLKKYISNKSKKLKLTKKKPVFLLFIRPINPIVAPPLPISDVTLAYNLFYSFLFLKIKKIQFFSLILFMKTKKNKHVAIKPLIVDKIFHYQQN